MSQFETKASCVDARMERDRTPLESLLSEFGAQRYEFEELCQLAAAAAGRRDECRKKLWTSREAVEKAVAESLIDPFSPVTVAEQPLGKSKLREY